MLLNLIEYADKNLCGKPKIAFFASLTIKSTAKKINTNHINHTTVN